MPPSPLRGEGFGRSVGSAQISIPFPSSVTAAPCHLPPGEGTVRANLAFPLPGGRWPAGPDEGGYRWVRRPTAGGWGHPPLRRVTIDFVGAAVPSGPSITGAPPWSPSSVMAAPCRLLPCGAKALAVLSEMLKCRWRSPHPSRAYAHATFPQGKAKNPGPENQVRGFPFSFLQAEAQHFSKMVATPWPPPMHRVARPFLASSRLSISWSRVTMMRAPEAPTG